MKFGGPLIVVENMAVSRKFYEEVLGLKVISDFGANITFEGGFSLQTKESWMDFIENDEIYFGSRNFELYFEEKEDLNRFSEHLKSFKKVNLVHDIKEFPWGQRVIRFYDPDQHIIEVGESMPTVVKRYLSQGLSTEEISQKTMMPVEFINTCK